MIKISRTNINPPDGRGNQIEAVDITCYDTNNRSCPEYRYRFSLGQHWSRGGPAAYRIDRIFIKLNRRGMEIRALMRSVNSPQQLEVGLITLINFWTQFDNILKIDIIDKRFEVIDI